MIKVVYLSFAQSQPIDWDILKQNVSAVMIRTGQGGYEDTLFRTHYLNAVNHQVPLGLWHFLQPNQGPDIQVNKFLEIYNSLSYKPRVKAWDVENIQYTDRVTGQAVNIQPPSVDFNHNNVMTCCQRTLDATGGEVGIYTRKNYFEQWTRNTKDWYKFWMWIAAWYNYTGVVKPALPWQWPDYKIHQYEGGTGRIEGITGPVCLEYFNGTAEECKAFFAPPWVETPPVVTPPSDHEVRIAGLEKWASMFTPYSKPG